MSRTHWKIHLGREAEKDFLSILKWTRKSFGAEQARRYRFVLTQTLASLGNGPDVPGHVRRDLISPGLRSLHVRRDGHRGRHFVLYRQGEDNQIEVVRILYDGMDLARHIPPRAGDDGPR